MCIVRAAESLAGSLLPEKSGSNTATSPNGILETAKSVSYTHLDRAGLFDKVTIYNELAKQEMTLQIVTTLRQDALKGLISKESPVGKALLGRQVGDRVQVEVSPELKYWVEIRAIEKGRDDESLEISSY